jgi:alpha-glucosidase
MHRLRHAHPGLVDVTNVSWPETPEGVFAVRRGAGFACVVNCSDEPVTSPIGGYVITASDATVHLERNVVLLPPDTGAWIQS